MTFVSYAQNFEDVMLWRALRHVEEGFYIDIGAQDPVIDSVSLAFYEHGWRGVHVEPTSQYAEKLSAARADETVMQVAIGVGDGTLTFFEFNDTGLSTADPVIAQRHKQNGFAYSEHEVPLMSLDALLDKFGSRPIHWLKLDVEGLEKSVLESWQLALARPWILVIESTLPSTQTTTHADWESLVLSKGYEFAYFDGLNRFYVSKEQPSLKQAFDSPPNIFDGFVLSGLASQPFYAAVAARAHNAEAQAQQAQERAREAEAHAQQAQHHAVRAETLLNQVMNSRSWRITAPLRWCGLQARQLRAQGFSARTKALVKKIGRPTIRRALAFVNARPALRQRCVRVIHQLGLYDRMRSFYSKLQHLGNAAPLGTAGHHSITELEQLSPHARRVYQDLEDAIEKCKKAL